MTASVQPEKLVWWILGVMGTGVITGGTLWVNSISSQMMEFKREIKELRTFIDVQMREMQKETAAAIQQRGDRISVVEVKQAVQDTRMSEIEKKVDRILEILEGVHDEQRKSGAAH